MNKHFHDIFCKNILQFVTVWPHLSSISHFVLSFQVLHITKKFNKLVESISSPFVIISTFHGGNLFIFLQAISSLRSREDTIEKTEEAIDYVNDRLPSDDCIPVVSFLPQPQLFLPLSSLSLFFFVWEYSSWFFFIL